MLATAFDGREPAHQPVLADLAAVLERVLPRPPPDPRPPALQRGAGAPGIVRDPRRGRRAPVARPGPLRPADAAQAPGPRIPGRQPSSTPTPTAPTTTAATSRSTPTPSRTPSSRRWASGSGATGGSGPRRPTPTRSRRKVDQRAVQYHLYAQWQTDVQLSALAEKARRKGLTWYLDFPDRRRLQQLRRLARASRLRHRGQRRLPARPRLHQGAELGLSPVAPRPPARVAATAT